MRSRCLVAAITRLSLAVLSAAVISACEYHDVMSATSCQIVHYKYVGGRETDETTFTYDDKGRLIKLIDVYKNASDRYRSLTLEYIYDDDGNIIEVDFSDGTSLRNTYNDRNQRIKREDLVGNFVLSTTLFNYNNAGQLNRAWFLDLRKDTLAYSEYHFANNATDDYFKQTDHTPDGKIVTTYDIQYDGRINMFLDLGMGLHASSNVIRKVAKDSNGVIFLSVESSYEYNQIGYPIKSYSRVVQPDGSILEFVQAMTYSCR